MMEAYLIDREDLFEKIPSRANLFYCSRGEVRNKISELSQTFDKIHLLHNSCSPRGVGGHSCYRYRVREEEHLFFSQSVFQKLRNNVLINSSISPLNRWLIRKEYGQYRYLKKSLFSEDYRALLARLLGDDTLDLIPEISIYIPTRRPKNIDFIIENINRQNYKPREVVIGLHGYHAAKSMVDERLKLLTIPYRLISFPREDTIGLVLNNLIKSCQSSFVVKMDDDDYYGGNYTRDIVLAYICTRAPVIGKAPLATYIKEYDRTYVRIAGLISKHKIVTPRDITNGKVQISGATISGLRQHFLNFPYDEVSRKNVDSTTFEMHRNSRFKIAVDDGDQILVNRLGRDHSWEMPNDKLSRNSHFFSKGHSEFWSRV